MMRVRKQVIMFVQFVANLDGVEIGLRKKKD
jgi:hypothetical protein